MTTVFSSKSVLVAESPPFNPGAAMAARTASNSSSHGGGTGSGGSPSHSSLSRSRSNSPAGVVGISGGNNNNKPHPSSNAVMTYTFPFQDGQRLEIRNVWMENVEEEMANIRALVQDYPYVAMDTEFPGVVAKPVTESYSPDYHYKSMKVNVDLLKIIQLGLSFADEKGKLAKICWQFNFHFDLDGDMFAQDSIDLLQKSGISFEDHAKRGINPLQFGELLMVSGLVLDDRVKWVSFHSGYDYGYLLKLLTTKDLPTDEKTFFELLRIYFPTIYDIKFMTSILDGHHFRGGLQRLADDLGCQRLGCEHQAGSDSLLTMSTYFALTKSKFTTSSGEVNDSKYANELFGYGNNHTVRKGPMHRELSSGNSNVDSE